MGLCLCTGNVWSEITEIYGCSRLGAIMPQHLALQSDLEIQDFPYQCSSKFLLIILSNNQDSTNLEKVIILKKEICKTIVGNYKLKMLGQDVI